MNDHRDDPPRRQPGGPDGEADGGARGGQGGDRRQPPPARRPAQGRTPGRGTPPGNPQGRGQQPGQQPPNQPGQPQRPAPRQPQRGQAPQGSQPGGPPPTSRVPNGRPPTGQRDSQGRPGGPTGGGPGGPSRSGRPAGAFEPSTENLPPVSPQSYNREPDLLTHRDDDHATEWASNAAESYDDRKPDSRYDSRVRGAVLSEEDRKTILKQKIFRRSRRTLYVLVGLGIIAPIVGFFIMYQIVKVPDPKAVAATLNQPITLMYADGSPMETIGTGENGHQLITTADLAKLGNIQHAVMAAEDSTFETNAGVDLKAILRTAYNQATGGSGGASTITQEYIKQATNPGIIGSLPLTTKVAEMVKAYKMSRTVDKPDIMASYLNIVYFGRGAYGIGAAAKTYFNETPDQLTNPQAALLAGLIQSPGRANSTKYQHQRYTYVMGNMAKNHWLNAGEQDAPLPPVQSATDPSASLPWDRRLIVNQVERELQANNLNMDDLQRMGAKVTTTIQPAAQTAAENSVQAVMAKDSAYTGGAPVTFNGKPVLANGKQVMGTQAAALVSVDPTTGGIIAWFGGNDPKATQFDMADTPEQAGSSFKPYVFASALQNDPQQEGLNTIFDGSNNQVLAGTTVHNAEGDHSGPVNVHDAMTQSINTVFYNMGLKTGLSKVRATAIQAGIPDQILNTSGSGPKTVPSLKDTNGVIEGGLSIGQYPVRPRDQAQGYATLANYGNYIPTHFITKVVDSQGSTLYTFNTPAKPAFGDQATSQSIAHTVIDSMTDVAAADKLSLSGNRPVAAKTGTQDYKDPNKNDPVPSTSYDSNCWMVGFTPSVVTAVWIGHYDRTAPIFGVGNNTEQPGSHSPYVMFGHEDPGLIWKTYMDSVVGKAPAQQFATYTDINGSWNFITNGPVVQTQPSQSSQPNNPSGGGGDTTTTTETTTKETTTDTQPTGINCGLICGPTTGKGHGGGGGGGGGGGTGLPTPPGG
ncbi:MAG TPA: transglycosylase domain-containing protein [Pseudonocardiaceae bacterium]|nr:transglycosylase domain-containing protein [Pseudonocardiaceae bacterium]